MNRRLHRVVFVIIAGLAVAALFVAAPVPAMASAAAPESALAVKRPKICVVLSGGGARGAAHVGVLKVLEEYRVPIDCITGTSMGALVGAAYASGMSIAEMEKIIGGISTELLFKERPPRGEQSMRIKRDDYTNLFTPEIGVGNNTVTTAKGLVSGVQLETVLRQISKVSGFRRFDELPIPFRAVATDLVTGKAVVFSEGELANVMRASMSVPGAVAPAEFGGMMLVDGMLTSNLPVDVARAMGADIVIAVNVGTPLMKREELNGILGVVGQMLSILTEQNVQSSLASLKATDVLISPELGEFSTGDFDNLPKIVPLGELAARKLALKLEQLSVPNADYAALRQRQQVTLAVEQGMVNEIRFEPLRHVNPAAVQAVMQTKAEQRIDQKTLDGDMRRIYGMGDFEHVNYRFLEESGKRVLVVDAVEKSWGTDSIRLGIGLSSDFKGDAFFNVLASYRRSWLNRLGGEWRTDLQVGRTNSLRNEFYQPLNDQGDYFVAPYAGYERRSSFLYQGSDRIASYDSTSLLAGVDVGTQLGRYGELRVGVARGTLRPRLDTGPQSLSPGADSIDQGVYRMRLVLDQLDSVRFPRSGWRGFVSVYNSNKGLGADDSYTKWEVDATGAFSFNAHTFSLSARAGGKSGSSPLPRYDQFQWGGFLQQSGYATGQLYGQKLAFGRILYYHKVVTGTLFEGAYAGLSLEAGKVSSPLVPGSPTGLLKSAAIFFSYGSPIGPVYLGYGRAADGNSSAYLYLGVPW